MVNDRGELTTILTFVNAFGEIVVPTIIHKAKQVQSDWRHDCLTNYDLTCSGSGLINEDLFYVAGSNFTKWLQKQDRLVRNHILLLDGHSDDTFKFPFIWEMKDSLKDAITRRSSSVVLVGDLPRYCAGTVCFLLWTVDSFASAGSCGKERKENS